MIFACIDHYRRWLLFVQTSSHKKTILQIIIAKKKSSDIINQFNETFLLNNFHMHFLFLCRCLLSVEVVKLGEEKQKSKQKKKKKRFHISFASSEKLDRSQKPCEAFSLLLAIHLCLLFRRRGIVHRNLSYFLSTSLCILCVMSYACMIIHPTRTITILWFIHRYLAVNLYINDYGILKRVYLYIYECVWTNTKAKEINSRI